MKVDDRIRLMRSLIRTPGESHQTKEFQQARLGGHAQMDCMTHHRLPAGTDVAEMALFDSDALPLSGPLDGEGLDELVSRERLIRLPTGADGGYLLHLYVDESPPEQVMRYCVTDDRLDGQFFAAGGRIAFGGVESTFQHFKPNSAIRSDAVIPAGSYTFTAYRTDIPEEVFNQAIKVASTSRERWLDRAPMLVVLVTICFTVMLMASKSFIGAVPVLALGYVSFKGVKRLPDQGALAARRNEAQLDLPSIVIELRPNPSIAEPTVRAPAG